MRKHGLLLAALITSSVFVAPSPAQASSATLLVNNASGLDGTISGCQSPTCMNGKGLTLTRTGNTFEFVGVPGGGYHIRSYYWENKCLDVWGTGNGEPVVMYDCRSDTSQTWTPWINYKNPASDNTWIIVNKWSGKCLDARNPAINKAPPSGAVLQMWDCNEAFRFNQRWDIKL
ncbi:RICIN domain-containing protein [Streptomyces sp. NPDC048269]|uniref:RICIN domain-containing protein n=1 Tax=Streptomyces sp. NPDC048269 TaxID=3155753 RepID=UPI00343EAAC4